MSLALLIATLVSTAIAGVPGISPAAKAALDAIASTLGVISKSGLGTGTPATVSVVLATLSEVITELKATPGISQTVLADIAVLEDAVAAALAADKEAAASVDPTKLLPIAPVA